MKLGGLISGVISRIIAINIPLLFSENKAGDTTRETATKY